MPDKKWRDANRERVREINRKWYANHKKQISEAGKKWRAENPGLSAAKERKSHLRKTYNLSLADYAAMFLAQNGKCAICLRSPNTKRLSVDHDHKTGRIRGLLCTRCNRAIALLWEDEVVLQRAIGYLR